MDLWVADVGADGSLGPAEHVAGSPSNWTTQPQWSADGTLHFVDERSGWLNLYRRIGRGASGAADARDEPIAPEEAEFAWPEWQFAAETYGFAGDGRIIAIVRRGGRDELWSIAPDGAEHRRIELPYTELGAIRVDGSRAVFSAASPTAATSLVLLDLDTEQPTNLRVSRAPRSTPPRSPSPGRSSSRRPGGRRRTALSTRRRTGRSSGPTGELPPLIVTSHGGPTASAFGGSQRPAPSCSRAGATPCSTSTTAARPATAATTASASRASGGSSTWTTASTGARYLAEQGLVDGERLGDPRRQRQRLHDARGAGVQRRSSRPAARTSGSATCERSSRTPTSSSRATSRAWSGRCPRPKQLYLERSPLNSPTRSDCPVLDPAGRRRQGRPGDPGGADRRTRSSSNGIPHAYLLFEGEDHGFRRAENIIRSFEAELSFYGQVFGFTPADEVEPVTLVRD